MIYQIIKTIGKKVFPKESYDNLKSAQNKIKRSYDKLNTTVILIPTPTVGMILHKGNKEKYGVITKITDIFIFIKKDNVVEDSFFQVSKFKSHFINGDLLYIDNKKLVSCENCIHYRLDDESIQYCPYEDYCNINNPEFLEPNTDRSFYEEKEKL